MLTRKFYLLLFIFSFLTACDKPDSSPELKDPVYQDLKQEESSKQKEIDAKLKEYADIEKNQINLLDNDPQKKLNRQELFRLQNEISKLTQMKEYYKVSAESRQIYARKQYLEYYKTGKASEWPPKDLKERYETQKKLSETPKRWSRGVASKKAPKKADK